MHKAVEHLLQNPSIRYADNTAFAAPAGLSTGFQALDQALPGQGWPVTSLTEILVEQEGVGELSLLMPALATLSVERRWIAWISPPHIPYGPALAAHGVDLSRVLLVHARPGRDACWALEQALCAGTCSSVLAWPGSNLDGRVMRRLQLAAESGRTTGFLFRSAEHIHQPSTAALRLGLKSTADGLQVQVLKCRGRSGARVFLEKDDALVESVFPYPVTGSAQSRQLRH